MTNFVKKNKWQIQIHISLKKSIQNFVSWYWQKIIIINHLMHSENKHIYCTLVSFSITELEDAM